MHQSLFRTENSTLLCVSMTTKPLFGRTVQICCSPITHNFKTTDRWNESLWSSRYTPKGNLGFWYSCGCHSTVTTHKQCSDQVHSPRGNSTPDGIEPPSSQTVLMNGPWQIPQIEHLWEQNMSDPWRPDLGLDLDLLRRGHRTSGSVCLGRWSLPSGSAIAIGWCA